MPLKWSILQRMIHLLKQILNTKCDQLIKIYKILRLTTGCVYWKCPFACLPLFFYNTDNEWYFDNIPWIRRKLTVNHSYTFIRDNSQWDKHLLITNCSERPWLYINKATPNILIQNRLCFIKHRKTSTPITAVPGTRFLNLKSVTKLKLKSVLWFQYSPYMFIRYTILRESADQIQVF